jgi:hypothetical protein
MVVRRGAVGLSSRKLYVARMSPRSHEGTKRSPYVRLPAVTLARVATAVSGLALGVRVLLPTPRLGRSRR